MESSVKRTIFPFKLKYALFLLITGYILTQLLYSQYFDSVEKAFKKNITATLEPRWNLFMNGFPYHLNCKKLASGDKTALEKYLSKGRVVLEKEPDLPMDCLSITQRIITSSHTQHPKDMPYAVASNVYKDYLVVETILGMSYSPKNSYCYALDRKSTDTFKRNMKTLSKCFKNVQVLQEEFPFNSRGHFQDHAHFRCTQELLKKGNWTYVLYSQNHDVPIRTNSEISQIIQMINGSQIHGYDKPRLDRYDSNRTWTARELGLFKNEAKYSKIQLDTPIKIFKTPNEVFLSRDFVTALDSELNMTLIMDAFNVQKEDATCTLKPYGQLYRTDQCSIVENITCQTKIAIVVFSLRKISQNQMDDVKQFLFDASSNCGNSATYGLIDPSNRVIGNLTKATLYNFTAELTPANVLLTDGFLSVRAMKDGNAEIINFFNGPPQEFNSTALYFFTDMLCNDFCNPNVGDLTDFLDLFSYFLNIFAKMGTRIKVFTINDVSYTQQSPCYNLLNSYRIDVHVGIPKRNTSANQDGFCQANIVDSTPPTDDDGSNGVVLVTVIVASLAGVIFVLVMGWIVVRYYRQLRRRRELEHRFYIDKDNTSREVGVNNIYTSKYPKTQSTQNKTDDWEVHIDQLTIHQDEKLGSGAFGNVFKGIVTGNLPIFTTRNTLTTILEFNSSDQFEVAVKSLQPNANKDSKLDLIDEMEFMKGLGHHVHVIGMLGCVSNMLDPLLLVELCEKGDLLKFLRSHRDYANVENGYSTSSLEVKEMIQLAWQIADGLSYLHSHNFIHRDIAARNILLTRNMVAKISDFGLCRYADSDLYTARGGKLPIKWMSIESLKLFEYSSKSDV